MVFAMWPITFAAGYPILIHMFTAYEPRHRCYIPDCDPEIGQGIKNKCQLSFDVIQNYIKFIAK